MNWLTTLVTRLGRAYLQSRCHAPWVLQEPWRWDKRYFKSPDVFWDSGQRHLLCKYQLHASTAHSQDAACYHWKDMQARKATRRVTYIRYGMSIESYWICILFTLPCIVFIVQEVILWLLACHSSGRHLAKWDEAGDRDLAPSRSYIVS